MEIYEINSDYEDNDDDHLNISNPWALQGTY